MYLEGRQHEEIEYPRMGDVVEVPGLVRHVGIFDGAGVIHNQKGVGVQAVSWDDFIQGRPWRIISASRPLHERLAILDGAFRYIGTSYDALSFNCEHFVNLILSGEPSSPTVRGLVALGVIAGGLALASKSSG